MANNFKRLLSLVIVLVMLVGMIPGNAFTALATEEVTVDTVIDTEAELAAALAAGGNVVLGGDITVTETITIPAGVTVTLDLAGKTISQTQAQTANYQMILVDGDLTVQDSVGGGKISYTDTFMPVLP